MLLPESYINGSPLQCGARFQLQRSTFNALRQKANRLVDYSRCDCGNPASVTAGHGTDDQEPQCLSCAVGTAALMYCAGTIQNNAMAIEAGEGQLDRLKNEFPWENVQELYDKHVIRLNSNPGFYNELMQPE